MSEDRFVWMPERGTVAQLTPQSRQLLWQESRLHGVWRPAEVWLDQWWRLVGRQEP